MKYCKRECNNLQCNAFNGKGGIEEEGKEEEEVKEGREKKRKEKKRKEEVEEVEVRICILACAKSSLYNAPAAV